jgi:hypothetical protein
MMLYAVLYTVMLNGTPYTLVEPMRSLSQCRAIADVMHKNRDEKYPDSQCVAIIPDKS